ncbi:hypothetical protein [Streptomyces sp. NBC_01089]|uniref:hypothetical protein n=1 Tax=Streptomyces sp. NBC_01089 TaxID=2903747 RepID=UPI00386808E6|nr:hypothetical protein OG510_13995 [Streptomyces sp. NBC_01089]
MSDQNPYASSDGGYEWGPMQPPGPPPPGYGYPNSAPGYGYPAQAPGYSYPQQPGFPVPAGGGAPLVSIGDITVVQDGIVTPAGTLPLRGAVWNATDMSRTEERIPPVAIVLAIVFALLCLIGLLFLLMKEKRTTGFIQVTVTSGGRHHATMIPATGPQTFPQVMGQLNYARSLSAL